MIGAALFEQERERKGGLIDFQFAPSEELSFNLTGFVSKLDAANYNRNYLEWLTHFVALGMGQAPDPGYTVRNNTLVDANFSPVSGTFYGVYDQISRPDESASSNFVTLEGRWKANDTLSFLGQVGTSEGHGKTGTQDVSETLPGASAGAGFQLNGTGRGPDFNFGAARHSTPFPGGAAGGFRLDLRRAERRRGRQGTVGEDRRAVRARQRPVDGAEVRRALSDARALFVQRDRAGPDLRRPNGGGTSTANYPTTFTNYPGDFHAFGGAIPSDIWYWTPEQLAAYNGSGLVNRDLLAREYYQYAFAVEEKNTAGYVQADLKGDALGREHRRALRADERARDHLHAGGRLRRQARSSRPRSGRSSAFRWTTPTTTFCRART